MTQPSDFQRESFRIDEQIWAAIGLTAGERVLFCGITADGAWIVRAAEIGADVSVIASEDAMIARAGELDATVLRGSATMIPAREGTFDVAIAFHYLHEVDPGFHAQIVAELARVGKRVVLVEPSPPADPLGRRIAALYSRAKRENGQFEQYQPIEYWRKLLAIVKADVWQSLFTFTRVPPKHAVAETVSLILEAMTIEDLPQQYLDELRAMAARPDAQLLPLSRIVLVGTPAGEPLPRSTTRFRPDVEVAPPPPKDTEPVAAITPAPPPPAPVPFAQPPAASARPAAAGARGFSYGIESEAPELPPAPPPPAPSPPRFSPPPGPEAPPPPATPFGAPFALPDEGENTPFGTAGAGNQGTAGGFGWSWEPPEGDENTTP